MLASSDIGDVKENLAGQLKTKIIKRNIQLFTVYSYIAAYKTDLEPLEANSQAENIYFHFPSTHFVDASSISPSGKCILDRDS